MEQAMAETRATTSDIKRGVSLYSYQEEYFLGTMTLEDQIRVSADMGARGIEVIGEQTFAHYPARLDEAVYDNWHHLMRTYGTTPVCHDFMLDYKKYKDRPMPFDEQVASCKVDIDLAARLGCSFTRALMSIQPDVLLACAEYAERKNVRILIEVHAPLHFDHPWVMRYAEIFDKSGSDYLGFLPDMGMFLSRFPRIWKDKFIRMGCPPHIADYIDKAYDDRVLCEYIIADVERMGGNGAAMGMAITTRHNSAFDPRRMLAHMSRIHNIHGKFYEMTEDLVEYSIPYDQIVAVLQQGGYRGYICSEYEGNRWIQDVEPVDSVEQVRRQQMMLKHLIEAPATAALAAA
jgi:hypothetical protein